MTQRILPFLVSLLAFGTPTAWAQTAPLKGTVVEDLENKAIIINPNNYKTCIVDICNNPPYIFNICYPHIHNCSGILTKYLSGDDFKKNIMAILLNYANLGKYVDYIFDQDEQDNKKKNEKIDRDYRNNVNFLTRQITKSNCTWCPYNVKNAYNSSVKLVLKKISESKNEKIISKIRLNN